MSLSIGKLRVIQQVSDEKGFMTICAIDHRGALRRAINEQSPDAVAYQDMVDFKLDLYQAVAPYASACYLIRSMGVAQAVATGVLPGHIGLLVSLEKTGYSGEKTTRIIEFLSGWSSEKSKERELPRLSYSSTSVRKALVYQDGERQRRF